MAKGDKADKKADKKTDKKSEGSGEEYRFDVPDFDEDAFIHKEMVSFRTTTILFGWGIVAALVTWLVYTLMGGSGTAWYLGLLIVGAFGYLLKIIYARLNVDISHFGRREWLGTGFLLFFTWLAFTLLFLNPPISDHAAPNVELYANPPIQLAGGDITFDVFYEDNHRIAEHTFTLRHGNGDILATEVDLADLGHGHYQYTLPAATASTYTVNATATDPAGHSAATEIPVAVSTRAVRFDDDGTLADHELASRTQVLLVTMAAEVPVRAVYLDLDLDGALTIGTDVVMEYDDALGGWKATANFAGWQEGTNAFQVAVEIQNRFMGLVLMEGETLLLSSPDYYLNVTAPIGDYQAPVLAEQTVSPNVVRTPGPGPLLVAGAILGGAAVIRRRQ